MIYQFEKFTIDSEQYQLNHNDESVHVEPLVFDLLLYLIENRDRVVGRDELLDNLWSGKVVSDSALAARLKDARRVLGDSGTKQAIIKTVHGRGYQFIAHLDQSDNARTAQKVDADGVEMSDRTHSIESLLLQCQNLDLPLPSKPSVILMPFKDHSAGGDLGYIAEGIRIDVQCALVKITGLFVIAVGTGSAVYVDRDAAPQQVSREMGVQYVLEASVRGNSGRLRVTAQLTDGTNGQVLWTEQYDRVIDDSFAVQDEIAQKIITSMDVKLVSGEQAKVWRKTLRNPKALELYYRAIDRLSDFDKTAVADARRIAEKVTEISPDVALGPTFVAFCHYWDATMGWGDDIGESLDQASEWAVRAAAMEDATGEAHIILAHVKLLRGHHDEAETIAEEAVKIRPHCANTNALSANILVYCGKPVKAIEHVKAAIRHAPAYASWWVEIAAAAYRDSGQSEMAAAAAREALRLRPDSTNGLALLSSALMAAGSETLAREAVSQIRNVDPTYSLQAYARMHPYRDSTTLDAQLAQLRRAGLGE